MWRRRAFLLCLVLACAVLSYVGATGRGAALLEELQTRNGELCRNVSHGPVESLFGALEQSVKESGNGGVTIRYPANLVACPKGPVKKGTTLMGFVLAEMAAEPTMIPLCNTSNLRFFEDKNSTGGGYWFFDITVLVPLPSLKADCVAPPEEDFIALLNAEIEARAAEIATNSSQVIAAAAAALANATSA